MIIIRVNVNHAAAHLLLFLSREKNNSRASLQFTSASKVVEANNKKTIGQVQSFARGHVRCVLPKSLAIAIIFVTQEEEDDDTKKSVDVDCAIKKEVRIYT